MNYNSIDEILSAGTTNMTALRNNTKQDDGTDTINGVSWFTFNGTVASQIYASGNSWIGFGSSSEHLKVDRRDAAMYSLYREEGTLYDQYKFLKIRWVGSGYYGSTSSSYALAYDVILWDTGDISLHMISIPSGTYNNGTYSLTAGSTYSYTVSTSSKDVTFTKTDSGFTVSNSLIQLKEIPKRYLIRSGSTYYTEISNVLSEVAVDTLTSAVFLENGVKKISNVNLLLTLEEPELLFWRESDEGLKQGLVLSGTPTLPQIVYENYSINSSIEKAVAISSDDVLFSVSFDGGQTWKYYNNGNWVTTTSESEGMTNNTIKNIPSSAWASIATSSTIRFRCVLTSKDSYVSNVYFKLL